MIKLCVGVIVGAAVYSAAVPRADACSCSAPDEVRVHPPHEATGVPPDTRVLVVAPTRPGDDVVVVLQDEETDESVALAVDQWAAALSTGPHYVWARPEEPLAPGRRYEISVDGEVISAFEVGDDEDEGAPDFAGIAELDLYRFESDCYSSCWEDPDAYHRVWAIFPEPPKDAVLLVLELLDAQGNKVFEAPLTDLEGKTDAVLDSITCAEFRPPQLSEGDELCARVIAYDGSGNASGGAAEQCATVQRCLSPCDRIPFERGVCPDQLYGSFSQDGGLPTRDGSPGQDSSSGGCAVRPGAAPPVPWPAAVLALAFLLRVRSRRERPAHAGRSR